jgi:hypothetical protein
MSLILHHEKNFTLPRVHFNILLLGLFLRNQHGAEARASLLMRFTCNKGLTNPEYKSTQQELTDEGVRFHGYAR